MWPFGRMMHKRRGLRGWVLSILAASPKNGAEIMNAIEEMSQGWWKPSPGSIYPLLQEFEKEGLIRKVNDRYELTEEARHELEGSPWMPWSRPKSTEDLVNEMDSYISYLEDIKKSDGAKFKANAAKLKAISNRMNALVREGGDNQ